MVFRLFPVPLSRHRQADDIAPSFFTALGFPPRCPPDFHQRRPGEQLGGVENRWRGRSGGFYAPRRRTKRGRRADNCGEGENLRCPPGEFGCYCAVAPLRRCAVAPLRRCAGPITACHESNHASRGGFLGDWQANVKFYLKLFSASGVWFRSPVSRGDFVRRFLRLIGEAALATRFSWPANWESGSEGALPRDESPRGASKANSHPLEKLSLGSFVCHNRRSSGALNGKVFQRVGARAAHRLEIGFISRGHGGARSQRDRRKQSVHDAGIALAESPVFSGHARRRVANNSASSHGPATHDATTCCARMSSGARGRGV